MTAARPGNGLSGGLVVRTACGSLQLCARRFRFAPGDDVTSGDGEQPV